MGNDVPVVFLSGDSAICWQVREIRPGEAAEEGAEGYRRGSIKR